MADWILTLGLQNLRSQINARWQGRDKTSDGTIGDAAHQAETSGHNRDDTPGSRPEWDGDPDSTPEVRAFDCDSDFREAGTTAQMVVDHIRALPAASSVLRYMIYNRKIYSASNGWAAQAYTGASAHTEHIHFSGAYTQAADNNTTFDYRLEEVGNMALTADDLLDIRTQVALGFYDALWSAAKGTDVGSPVRVPYSGVGNAIATNLQALVGKPVDQAALLTAIAADGGVDETALAAALVPGIANAIVQALPAGALTKDDVEAAVRDVLRTGVGS